MEYVTSTFRLPKETYEQIRIEAFNRRVSIAEILRDACDVYFETRECLEYIKNHELKVQGDVDEHRQSDSRCNHSIKI